jgi:hypothetical protein
MTLYVTTCHALGLYTHWDILSYRDMARFWGCWIPCRVVVDEKASAASLESWSYQLSASSSDYVLTIE